MLGHALGVADGVLALADDAEDLLAAGEKAFASFIEEADALSETPTMRAELAPKETLAPLPPIRVDSIKTLDLRKEKIGTIIWSMGYGFGFDWVKLPITDARGAPIQERGATASPGVYFLGLHWMHTFRSAILSFVGRDAAYIADHMDRLPQ